MATEQGGQNLQFSQIWWHVVSSETETNWNRILWIDADIGNTHDEVEIDEYVRTHARVSAAVIRNLQNLFLVELNGATNFPDKTRN